MKILVKAKPGAKTPRVTETTDLFAKDGQRRFTVAVREPATEGRANRAIERALAEHFGVPPSRVAIVKGHASREKVVEVAGVDQKI